MENTVVLTCPRCGASLPQHFRWMRLCSACGTNVRVDLFRAALRATERGQAGETILDETESSCFYHPVKRAVVPCEICGRFLCALCDLNVEGKHVCPTCLSREQTEDKGQRPKDKRTLYDLLASHIVILMLLPCGWYVMPFLAAIVVYLCLRYWNAPRSVLSPGRWRLVVSVSFAVALLGLWILAITTAFWGMA